MAANTWETFRKRDIDVLNAFVEIAKVMEKQGPAKVSIQLAEGYNPRTEAALKDIFEKTEIVKLLSLNESVAYHIFISFGHFTVVLQRVKDRATDTVNVQFNDSCDPDALLTLIAESRKQFPSYTLRESAERLLGPEVAQFYQSREAALTKLEATAQKLIEDTTGYRLTLDAQAALKEAARMDALKQERTELQTEFQSRLSKLEEREKELNERSAKLDDRDSKHARRALRQSLQAELKQRAEKFSLTSGTNRKRFGIHAVFASLMIVFFGLLGFFVYEAWSVPLSLTTALRTLGATAGLLTVCILYARWMDNWFRQHADEEFRLKRLELDIDRASLVVETALEWQQQSQSQIPPQLLEQLSRGLFESGGKNTTIRHPVEDLAAAILSASSSLKVNLPGVGEATLNRKGVKQLNDAIEG